MFICILRGIIYVDNLIMYILVYIFKLFFRLRFFGKLVNIYLEWIKKWVFMIYMFFFFFEIVNFLISKFNLFLCKKVMIDI